MEQKKLSYIFEEEFKKWTSLKIFWICLAVMVAGFLALCATVFYLDNGSAAEVLSGKEQLMANVWGRVFAVISVMPVVIILFMFGSAALIGGLCVLAEKKKRKQAAIPGALQIQKQSKDNDVAAQEQPALVEPEESKAAEQEQMVPVAQAEVPQVQPEPIAQEPEVEQAETVESEDTQKEETPVPLAEEPQVQPEPIVQEPVVEQAETVENEETQKEETPVAQAEESPAQPEPTDQEPAVEQAEAADAEEVTESEDTEEETKKQYIRRDNYGKSLDIKINHDRLKSVFKQSFIRRNVNTNSCSYDTLVEALEGHGWKMSDLARLALLIYESDVLMGECAEMPFKDWLVRFFDMMGRDDYPKARSKEEYKEIWRSSIDFSKTFNDLVFTYYKNTGKTLLIIKEPLSQES